MRLQTVLGGEESVAAGDGAAAFRSSHVLQVLLRVNVQTAASREPSTTPFHRAGEGLRAQVGHAVALQVLRSCEGLATAFHGAGEPAVIVMFPFVPQKFGHAGECPATTVRVTHKRPLTCVAPQVDFQPTGFVVLLATSRKGAREELLLPKVSSVMGEQGAHGDERLLAAGKITLVRALGLEVAALVGAELGVRGEALGAHLALEQALLLVAFHVCFEVVYRGELLAAAAHRAAERPQLVVRL